MRFFEWFFEEFRSSGHFRMLVGGTAILLVGGVLTFISYWNALSSKDGIYKVEFKLMMAGMGCALIGYIMWEIDNKPLN